MYNTTPPPTPAPPSPPLIIPMAPSTPPSEHTASTVTAASPETINALIATHDGLLLPPPSPPLPPHTSDSTSGAIALSAIVTKKGTEERLKALMFDLKAPSEIPFPLSKHSQSKNCGLTRVCRAARRWFNQDRSKGQGPDMESRRFRCLV